MGSMEKEAVLLHPIPRAHTREAMITEEDTTDPTRPNLAAIAQSGHPFSLPTGRYAKTIFTGLRSSELKLRRNPWVLSCPFDMSTARLMAVIPDSACGGASFRDGMSTKAASDTDHLSASVGAAVGYPFLKAGATVDYDKTVIENTQGITASRNATCRVGRIILSLTPKFSEEAVEVLQRPDGAAQFQDLYGDFYVCGYELGGDAGACLSANSRSMSSEMSLKVTAHVKVLFFEASAKVADKSFYEASSSTSFTFCGYNTLDDGERPTPEKMKAEGAAVAELQQKAAEYLLKIASLDAEVRQQLEALGLKDGQEMSLKAASTIANSPMVVQILLAPFARMGEFIANAGMDVAL